MFFSRDARKKGLKFDFSVYFQILKMLRLGATQRIIYNRRTPFIIRKRRSISSPISNGGELPPNTRLNTHLTPQSTTQLFEAISELSQFGIKLTNFPSLVMLGPQSAGKTSVVEAICGRNFMPKKMGMATMKPFHITTIRSPNLRFKIRDKEVNSEEEAKELVDRLNSNPSVKKIDIQVWSPEVYDAFMVDLPGLFYVSKEDRELPKLVREMSEEYLKDPNNIPCVVTSATQDPATNQAIQLISEHNREPDSLGVITKMDMAANKLNTKPLEEMLKSISKEGSSTSAYGLGHSWVAVVLKNTKENDAGMTVQEKITHEARFFMKHPEFRPAGVPALREKISQVQFDRIKNNIPILLKEINSRIDDLQKSGSFLDQIISDPKNKLAFRLKMMIEKLVGSSLERAEFEDQLKHAFKRNLASYNLDLQLYHLEHRKPELNFSTKKLPSGILSYHVSNHTNPSSYADDNFRELFSYGLISPILVNSETIEQAFTNECNLVCSVPILDLCLNDPLGKKRLQWNKALRKYFDRMLVDDHVLKMIYETTESMILNYLHQDDQTDLDGITRKFSEYIVKEIGSEAYETNIRFALKAMINTEKRPLIPLVEICRHLAQMYPDNFKFDNGTFVSSWRGKDKRLVVDVYGHAFNEAYMKAVSDKLSENIYRSVAVNLLDTMVEKLLEMTIDMFNQETVLKEKTKISDKINMLKQTKAIIESYSSSPYEHHFV